MTRLHAVVSIVIALLAKAPSPLVAQEGRPGRQLPGDSNQDGLLDLSDGIYLLNFLFIGNVSGLPCGDATATDGANVLLLDFNGDDRIDLSDAVAIFGFLFLGTKPHSMGRACVLIDGCPPGPSCPPYPPNPIEVTTMTLGRIEAIVTFGEPVLSQIQAGGETWTQIRFPGHETDVGTPGWPSVPVFRWLVAVPEGAVPSIVGRPKAARTVKLKLYPFQKLAHMGEPTPDDYQTELPPDKVFQDPPFTIDTKAYSMDTPYPPAPASVRILGRCRDLLLAQVDCAAGQYTPATESMTLFSSMDIAVSFRGGEKYFVTQASAGPFESSPGLFAATVLNEPLIYKSLGPDIQRRPCLGEELLILTHPKFRAQAEALADWKRTKGISTNVFDVNDGTGPGPDSAEAIDALIEHRFEICQVRPWYVLLFGDAEYVPTFYENKLGASEPTAIASDYRYATYLEPDSPQAEVDVLPDFAVGRIPVDTETEAQTVVDKIIGYESNPPDDKAFKHFYENASIASHFQCCRTDLDVAEEGTDQRAFVQVVEDVRDGLLAKGFSVQRIYVETVDAGDPDADPPRPPYLGDPTPRYYKDGSSLPYDLAPGEFAWAGTTMDIINAFQAGRFLIIHLDHGGATGWSYPYFTTDQVSGLSNGPLLPVVFGFNCSSGYFDNETDDDSVNDSFVFFSERLLRRSGGGAVGTIAATRSTNETGNIMIMGYLDSAIPEMDLDFGSQIPNTRLGDMHNHGRLYMLEKRGFTDHVVNHLRLYHVFGDPTMEMWVKPPPRLPKNFLLIPYPDYFEIHYGEEGAIITALQEIPDGWRAVGRGTVKAGVARLDHFQAPVAGVPVQFSASLTGAVSAALSAR